MRRAIVLALVLLIASFSTVAANQATDEAYAEWANKDYCEYFEATDAYLCFGFRAYWHEFGGLEIFGYPITNEFQEDGRTVQYFERARFEWHPGVWPERHDVLQGLLGSELAAHAEHDHAAAFEPAEEADGDCVYYAQTGHNVCDEFLKRWEMSGGLATFGYPISEAHDHDGMTVQYFQRARFEHQPGAWPERHDVLFGLVGSEVYALKYGDEPEPPPQPVVDVVAADLVQPRGVNVTDHGVYVAEAGLGGDGECITAGSGAEVCFGLTGSVSLVTDEGTTQVVTGLPSLSDGFEGTGPHDTVVDDDGNLYVVIGYGANPAYRDSLGPDAAALGTLVKVDTDGDVTIIADLAAFEGENNPDGAVDEEGQPYPDANPYYLAMDGDDFIIADAGANALLRVSQDGEIEVIAVFPPRMVPAPPFIPAPEIPMESVPTGIAVGPDGNYYVGQLTGFPFPVGEARVYKVTPDGDVSIHAEGFTHIGDLAFDSEGRLFVLEIVKGGLLNVDEEELMAGDPTSVTSRIVQVNTDGSQVEHLFPGMFFATGLDIGPDNEIYVSNMAVLPTAQLLRIDLP